MTNEKIDFIVPTKIQVQHSPVEGRGVFATVDIKEGDIIERCPMVRLGYRSNYHHDPIIWKYVYTQPKCECNDCKNHGKYIWMVLGYGMIYNHQDIPNTKWVFKYNSEYADVVASKDIPKGKEIFVSYGTEYFKNRPKVVVDTDAPVVSPATPSPTPSPTPKVEEELEDDDAFMAKITKLMEDSNKQ
jgi:SET domain-containing protein